MGYTHFVIHSTLSTYLMVGHTHFVIDSTLSTYLGVGHTHFVIHSICIHLSQGGLSALCLSLHLYPPIAGWVIYTLSFIALYPPNSGWVIHTLSFIALYPPNSGWVIHTLSLVALYPPISGWVIHTLSFISSLSTYLRVGHTHFVIHSIFIHLSQCGLYTLCQS